MKFLMKMYFERSHLHYCFCSYCLQAVYVATHGALKKHLYKMLPIKLRGKMMSTRAQSHNKRSERQKIDLIQLLLFGIGQNYLLKRERE